MRYGAKVFYELFLKTREGGRLGIPTVPLSDFYGAAAERFVALGGKLRTRAAVAGGDGRRWAVGGAAGGRRVAGGQGDSGDAV